jgi:hypothetical protein
LLKTVHAHSRTNGQANATRADTVIRRNREPPAGAELSRRFRPLLKYVPKD